MTVRDIISYLESVAPLTLQESYDNSGLQAGDPQQEVSVALVCLDVTEGVIDEAIGLEAGLVIAHHPLIFTPLKNLTGKDAVQRTVIKAIRHNIAVYAAHTNLDVIWTGVNRAICDKLGLVSLQVLQPVAGHLRKLVFFVPSDHAPAVRQAVFEAGAGHIGEYDMCSFNLAGEGTFRGSETTNPYVGEKGTLHYEKETRVETIYPIHAEQKILEALLRAHPYEEVAYDIYPLENRDLRTGPGMTGELPVPVSGTAFLDLLKKVFDVPVIRHTRLPGKPVRRVAVCGGSGASLIRQAIASKSDIYVTSDIRYHQFFDAGDSIIIADIGHYESEQFTTGVIYDLLKKKFPTFAFHFSGVKTNPINYY
jgi:dinuclear metal center YbgI/SA1388 family protein